MAPNVSVVIATYNYGRFISEAIGSVLVQTTPPLEIVVVDDGSTDDTSNIIAKFGNRIRYIKQQNLGVCAARNEGIKRSTGELVAFLDADDTWEPTKLERQLAIIEDDGEVGLVHCGMREFDSSTDTTIAIHLEGMQGWISNSMILWEGPSVVAPGSTVLVKRSSIESVGDFDTRIKVGEDWDFCYRLSTRYKVGFVSEPLINYRRHVGGAHRNVRDMEEGMNLALGKAFAAADQYTVRLRRRSYGNYQLMLAGSYLHSRLYFDAFRNIVSAINNRPHLIFEILRRFRGSHN